MQLTDFIPHGMVTAFAGVVTYVFRDHVKQDDKRFEEIKTGFQEIEERQTAIADKMAANHTEILQTLLKAANDRANLQPLVEKRSAG
jgi:hypothetical protein